MENSSASVSPIARFSTPCRVWAIGAVRGEADKLYALRERLTLDLRPGDKLVYSSNIVGPGAQVRKTVDEVLGVSPPVPVHPGRLCRRLRHPARLPGGNAA